MMQHKSPEQLLQANKQWAAEKLESDPEFFSALADGQQPEYLWIGCSDSRVPATDVVGLKPGEMFVHRNIANVVPPSDLNVLSVIQYAVQVLKVKHIIVAGHYGCGGVKASMDQVDHGEIENWLAHIKDVYLRNFEEVEAISDPQEKVNRMCELNVAAQVVNVARTTIVQNAWKSGNKLKVHGWIYDLKDGILHDLDVSLGSPEQLHEVYRIND